MRKLILVRHGETEGNVAKILDTTLPGLPLTEHGVAQAKTFGASLSIAPHRLFCSKALRATQTASYIAAATGVRAETLDGVHEVQVGDLDGQHGSAAHETFQQVYRSWHDGDLAPRLPGGESGYDVLTRFLPVLEELRTRYLTANGSAGTGDVLLVNHGAAMRLVGRTVAGVEPPFSTNNHLDNTEVIELVPRILGGWECLRWGQFRPPFELDAEPTADDPMG